MKPSSIERSPRSIQFAMNTAAPQRPVSTMPHLLIRRPIAAIARKVSNGVKCGQNQSSLPVTSHSKKRSIMAAVSLSGRSDEPWPATRTLKTNSMMT